jgi:hypothetical protein
MIFNPRGGGGELRNKIGWFQRGHIQWLRFEKDCIPSVPIYEVILIMRSCKTTIVRPSFSIIWVLLMVLCFLLPLTMVYPAFAMSDSSQPTINDKQNHQLPDSVLKAVQQDLAKQTNLPAEEFKLSNATHESWTDGCLGLALPGEMCSQALIDGWRVVINRGKQTWVYRTDTNGRVVRQEG